MPNQKVIDDWKNDEDRGIPVFLTFGQTQSVSHAETVLRKANEVFKKLNQRCQAKITEVKPLSWAIQINLWSRDLYGYAQFEIMDMLIQIMKHAGEGEYFVRGGLLSKPYPDLWNIGKEYVDFVGGVFDGVPLRILVEKETVVINILFGWVTKFMELNYSHPIVPAKARNDMTTGIREFMSGVAQLCLLYGDWLLEIDYGTHFRSN